MSKPPLGSRSLVLTAILAGLSATLAYPPFNLFPLKLVSMGVLLWVMGVSTRRTAAIAGFAYGVAFYSTLFTWLAELGSIALVPLVAVEALFPMALGLVLPQISGSSFRWVIAATGWWSGLEWVRARFPLGGFEWGQAGYSLGELRNARKLASLIGVSGLTTLLAAVAAIVAIGVIRRHFRIVVSALVGLTGLLLVGSLVPEPARGDPIRVAIVQGRSLCDLMPCDRYSIYLSHLELTRTIEPGTVDLVVWSEGSTGSYNADPLLNEDVGLAIGEECRRLGAVFLVGGDRPLSDTEWLNANVVFNRDGEIIGEYRKRHPVPFGEYVPKRGWFGWVPGLEAVPRDMVPGDGPVVFDAWFGDFGSIISFEGAFSRYGKGEVRSGATFLVLATSQASYPLSRASDQFIAMTSLRSAELGVDIVHAAVSGRSTFMNGPGDVGAKTGRGEKAVLFGSVAPNNGGKTLFVRWGDWLMTIAAWAALAEFGSRRMSELHKNRL